MQLAAARRIGCQSIQILFIWMRRLFPLIVQRNCCIFSRESFLFNFIGFFPDHCSLNSLNSESVQALNDVVPIALTGSLIVVVEVTDAKILHSAAMLSNSPFKCGLDEKETVTHFQNWILDLARDLKGASARALGKSGGVSIQSNISQGFEMSNTIYGTGWISQITGAGLYGKFSRFWWLSQSKIDGHVDLIMKKTF